VITYMKINLRYEALVKIFIYQYVDYVIILTMGAKSPIDGT